MDAASFFIVPAAGKTVRDPKTGTPLPADGATKPKTSYWLRRVREGSVTVKPASRVTVPAPLSINTTKKGDAK